MGSFVPSRQSRRAKRPLLAKAAALLGPVQPSPLTWGWREETDGNLFQSSRWEDSNSPLPTIPVLLHHF